MTTPTHIPDLNAARDTALSRIAPLWPIDTAVAVNPYLGYAGDTLFAATTDIAAASGRTTTMPAAYYLDKVASGDITIDDLETALVAVPGAAPDVATLLARAEQGFAAIPATATIADLTGQTATVTAEVARFMSGWAAPTATALPFPYAGDLWTAWCGYVRDSRKLAAIRPAITNRDAVLPLSASTLGLASDAQALRYFTRLVYSLPGWAAHARYRSWSAELRGETDSTLNDLFLILLSADLALADPVLPDGWTDALARMLQPLAADPVATAVHVALEAAEHRDLRAAFDTAPPVRPTPRKISAAFCIDVRSEVFRRAVEVADPQIDTRGVAGFFGMPIAHRAAGTHAAAPMVPVLLAPAYEIAETAGEGPDQTGQMRQTQAIVETAWKTFRGSAVGAFGFVEAVGVTSIARLVGAAMRVPGLGVQRSERCETDHGAPDLSTIAPYVRIQMARDLLAALAMPEPDVDLLLLIGHGGASVNNAHEAALHCGACGGHAGNENARMAAAILNDPAVREALDLPHLVAVAGLHNTTTDAVTLYDTDTVPPSHQAALRDTQAAFDAARKTALAERAARLPKPLASHRRTPADRAKDWAQTRPEWGLAGCSRFVIAPRHRTAGIDLGGRAFLHSYDRHKDDGFAVLETILTAPLVVGSWISLQYFGSTTAPTLFGASDKTLHNPLGKIGVVEGNGGDLRSGFPLQSVHNGMTWENVPVRLNAVVEAPEAAMDAIIARHDGLRALLDNGWIHLFSLDADGRIAGKFEHCGTWRALQKDEAQIAA